MHVVSTMGLPPSDPLTTLPAVTLASPRQRRAKSRIARSIWTG